MTLDVSKVAEAQIKNARTGEMVPLKSLWQDQTTLIVLFRRWGCLFCRVWAKEISDLAPALKENNVRLVGIGVDEIGLEDFIQGNYFPGELFIDSNKTIYSGLNLKRFSYLSILTALFTKESRDAISKGRSEKLGGDLRGDGLQNGGALIVKKGGEVIFSFKQDRPAEHVSNEDFAKALGIKYASPASERKEDIKCTTDGQCSA